MNLSRRNFLQLLGMAGPVAAVAPSYFFAPVGGWKSDVIVNPVEVPEAEFTVNLFSSFWNEQGGIATRFERVQINDLRPKPFARPNGMHYRKVNGVWQAT